MTQFFFKIQLKFIFQDTNRENRLPRKFETGKSRKLTPREKNHVYSSESPSWLDASLYQPAREYHHIFWSAVLGYDSLYCFISFTLFPFSAFSSKGSNDFNELFCKLTIISVLWLGCSSIRITYGLSKHFLNQHDSLID